MPTQELAPGSWGYQPQPAPAPGSSPTYNPHPGGAGSTPYQARRHAERSAVGPAMAQVALLRDELQREQRRARSAERKFSLLLHLLRKGATVDAALADVESLFPE